MSSPTSLRVPCPRCGMENARVNTNGFGGTYEECPDCGHVRQVPRRPPSPDEQADRKQWAKARIGHAAFLGFCTREAA
jgi:hypothetical protein